MKPLTKTVVSRSGGIAARFAEAGEKPAKPRVANSVANPVANVANKPRYVRWREANPELWLERQRGYQAKHRERRAKAKEENK